MQSKKSIVFRAKTTFLRNLKGIMRNSYAENSPSCLRLFHEEAVFQPLVIWGDKCLTWPTNQIWQEVFSSKYTINIFKNLCCISQKLFDTVLAAGFLLQGGGILQGKGYFPLKFNNLLWENENLVLFIFRWGRGGSFKRKGCGQH